MQTDIRELLRNALHLPPEARGALACRLIESLEEQPSDPDAEQAWSKEIARRIEEIDRGEVRGVPWSEARRRILEDD